MPVKLTIRQVYSQSKSAKSTSSKNQTKVLDIAEDLLCQVDDEFSDTTLGDKILDNLADRICKHFVVDPTKVLSDLQDCVHPKIRNEPNHPQPAKNTQNQPKTPTTTPAKTITTSLNHPLQPKTSQKPSTTSLNHPQQPKATCNDPQRPTATS